MLLPLPLLRLLVAVVVAMPAAGCCFPQASGYTVWCQAQPVAKRFPRLHNGSALVAAVVPVVSPRTAIYKRGECNQRKLWFMS
jgi:hypothetical protein